MGNIDIYVQTKDLLTGSVQPADGTHVELWVRVLGFAKRTIGEWTTDSDGQISADYGWFPSQSINVTASTLGVQGSTTFETDLFGNPKQALVTVSLSVSDAVRDVGQQAKDYSFWVITAAVVVGVVTLIVLLVVRKKS